MNNSFIKASSDYAFNYTEYLVKRKADKSLIIARIGICLLAFLLFSVMVFLTFGPIKVPQITVVAVVLILFVAKLLWGFTSIEYEYVIVGGDLTMDKIYAGKKRKKMAEISIRSADAILPLQKANIDGLNTIFAASSMNSPTAYVAIYKDDDGEKCALIFDVCKKSVDMLKYYNKQTVVSPEITI